MAEKPKGKPDQSPYPCPYRRQGWGYGALGCLMIAGCFSLPVPLEVNSANPGQDHHAIADYYRREAYTMKLQAEEQRQRIVVYERLFGSDSEWVSGSRLLAQFYEQVAADYDHKAKAHQALARTAGSADSSR